MKKSLLIQALMAIAYASTGSAAQAVPTRPAAPMTKTCSCCKSAYNVFDIHHVDRCRNLADFKGLPVGDDVQ